jgi:translation initiation factor 1
MDSSKICSVCGLPEDLCVCTDAQKSSTIIEIKVEKRKYGKYWAVISGIDVELSELKAILKEIKNKMACGGTIKGKSIEILFGRGDRTKDLINVLESQGFDRNSIHVTIA